MTAASSPALRGAIAASALLAIAGAYAPHVPWLHWACKPLTTLLIASIVWRAATPLPRYRLWLLFGRWPYIPNSPTDPYHIRHVTLYELRAHCTRNGVRVVETAGHAGLWCRGLYPRWFSRRGIGRLVGLVYPTLVRLRPSFFARYLFVRGVKVEHTAGRVGVPDGHAHATPASGQAA